MQRELIDLMTMIEKKKNEGEEEVNVDRSDQKRGGGEEGGEDGEYNARKEEEAKEKKRKEEEEIEKKRDEEDSKIGGSIGVLVKNNLIEYDKVAIRKIVRSTMRRGK